MTRWLTLCFPWQDVKLRAAFCLCHVLRIYAPTKSHPYTARVLQVPRTPPFMALRCLHVIQQSIWSMCLQEVLGLFMHVFRRLDNPTAPSFQLCLSVLDFVSQVWGHLLVSCGVQVLLQEEG